MPLISLDLKGPWKFAEYPLSARRMEDLDSAKWFDTAVPCSIFHSLADAGLIKDTQIEADPQSVQWVSDKPWIYSKVFEASPELLACKKVELVFEGLDTVAVIWLNDKLIAKTANMFLTHRLDITSFIRQGQNRLLVKFEPPRRHAVKLMEKYSPAAVPGFSNPWRTYIRKAQYQFGSDFCPALEGCGIFRPCRIEGIASAGIADVSIRTIDANQHYADIRIAIQLAKTLPTDLRCRFRIFSGPMEIIQEIKFGPAQDFQSALIRIDRPFLWWPRGYGLQYTYNFELDLFDDSQKIDSFKSQFGIRTLRCSMASGAMQFEVNSEPVNIKGANWLPLALASGRDSEMKYNQMLDLAASAELNMLRVFGGGIYEDDAFYNACDKLGIMVWQDFMFDSAYYPDRQWFIDDMKIEAQQVIKRLRNHACLAIWCGNSQIDSMHSRGLLGRSKKFFCREIFHSILPQLISELDTGRDYIPSCPAVSKDSTLESPAVFWHVWKEHAPVRDYLVEPSRIPAFVAGFGMASLPSLELVKSIAPRTRPGAANIEKFNYELDGNSRLYRYTSDLFSPAQGMEDLIYKSQLTQARSAKLLVEHLRTHRSQNHGALLWSFNDCTAAISHSAVDYMLNPKAIYFYMRRFFAPVLAAFVPEYESPDSYSQPGLKSLGLMAVNETRNSITADFKAQLFDFSGKLIDQTSFPVSLAPFSTSAAFKLPGAFARPDDPKSVILFTTLSTEKTQLAQNTFLFVPDKYITWPQPKIDIQLLQVSDEFWKIVLYSEAPAKDVFVKPAQGFWPRDNFFDLLPHTELEITAKCADNFVPDVSKIQLRTIAD